MNTDKLDDQINELARMGRHVSFISTSSEIDGRRYDAIAGKIDGIVTSLIAEADKIAGTAEVKPEVNSQLNEATVLDYETMQSIRRFMRNIQDISLAEIVVQELMECVNGVDYPYYEVVVKTQEVDEESDFRMKFETMLGSFTTRESAEIFKSTVQAIDWS